MVIPKAPFVSPPLLSGETKHVARVRRGSHLSEVGERELVHGVEIGQLRDREVEQGAAGRHPAVRLARHADAALRALRLAQSRGDYLGGLLCRGDYERVSFVFKRQAAARGPVLQLRQLFYGQEGRQEDRWRSEADHLALVEGLDELFVIEDVARGGLQEPQDALLDGQQRGAVGGDALR